MMIESKNVKQFKGERQRRWFSDEYFDLIVWYDDDNSINGFQLCYNKLKSEHAITWKKRKGCIHEKIDNGENPGEHKKTPILISDGAFPKEKVAELFKSNCSLIDTNVAELVYEKIINY